MFRKTLILAAAFAGAATIATTVQAQDRASWFKSLKQPTTGYSCCDISDCRRTEAEWKKGQWWAKVEGEWTAIPDRKRLNIASIDGDAYVCSGPFKVVYCFVPPLMGL